MAGVATAAPPASLDHLDTIPSCLPACRQRVYSRQDVETFNLVAHPCWVFDVRQKCIWWANDLGVELWGAESLEDLLARDFAEGMSKTSENLMNSYLQKLHRGEEENFRVTWTFHPNQGRDGPKTCKLVSSGIYVDSKSNSLEKHDVKPGPWFCLLVQVEEVVNDDKKAQEDARVLRRSEMLKHFPIIARQFNLQGKLMDQNPEALAVFGSALTTDDIQQHYAAGLPPGY